MYFDRCFQLYNALYIYSKRKTPNSLPTARKKTPNM